MRVFSIQITLVLIIGLNFNCFGQNKEAGVMLQEAYSLSGRGSYDSALSLLDQIPINSSEGRDSLLLANIHYTKGLIYRLTYHYDSAFKYLRSSEQIARITNTYSLVGMSLEMRGQIYKAQGLLVMALGLYNEARNSYIDHDLPSFLGTVYSELGNLQSELNNHEAASFNHLESVKWYRETKDSTNLAVGLSNLARSQSESSNYKEAIENFGQAIELKKKHNTERSLSFTLKYLGESYLTQQSLDSAEKYLNQAYVINRKLNDLTNAAGTANLLAKIMIEKGNMTESREYLDSAIQWSESTKSLGIVIDNLEIQKVWYRLNNQNRNALLIDDRFDILRDSLFKEERLKVQELQTEYALDEKEKERQLAETRANLAEEVSQRQKIILMASIIVLLALLVIVYLIWRSRKLTTEKNALLESQNRLIEQQKNDIRHRTKNHMSMVSYILTLLKKETQDGDLIKQIQSAQHLLFTFSSLETHLYDRDHDSEIDVKNYLTEWRQKFLENLPPLETKYEIELNCDDITMSNTQLVSIALIVTELATNAMKYIALNGKDTLLQIVLAAKSGEVKMTVKDNGPGFSGSDQRGMGWRIISALIKSLKATSTDNHENGFCFEVIIPNKAKRKGAKAVKAKANV